MIFGYFTVIELTGDKDSAGYETQAKVKSQMNENIIGVLFLPPYLREAQSNIAKDSAVIGMLDEVSGLGCAFCGLKDADFGYFINADVSVKGDVKADGDVKAGSVSLKKHTHEIIPQTGTKTSSADGTIPPE